MVSRAPTRRYTPEEIDRGLLTLAMCGSSTQASRQLAAQGLRVSERTLRDWKNVRHPGRYHDLAEQHSHEIESVILEQARETAVLAAEVERQALALTSRQIAEGTVKDAAGAARNAATVKGINLDKVFALTGRPERVVEHRNPDEIVRALVAKGVLQLVDGNGREVPPRLPAGDDDRRAA